LNYSGGFVIYHVLVSCLPTRLGVRFVEKMPGVVHPLVAGKRKTGLRPTRVPYDLPPAIEQVAKALLCFANLLRQTALNLFRCSALALGQLDSTHSPKYDRHLGGCPQHGMSDGMDAPLKTALSRAVRSEPSGLAVTDPGCVSAGISPKFQLLGFGILQDPAGQRGTTSAFQVRGAWFGGLGKSNNSPNSKCTSTACLCALICAHNRLRVRLGRLRAPIKTGLRSKKGPCAFVNTMSFLIPRLVQPNIDPGTCISP
jgi:hypothetical protein